MATQHYNLPTFDGAQADQPINFKTGMTDAFTKIDTQMYANATGIEGKADVADLSTLETMVEAISNRIESIDVIVEKLNANYKSTALIRPRGDISSSLTAITNGIITYIKGEFDSANVSPKITLDGNTFPEVGTLKGNPLNLKRPASGSYPNYTGGDIVFVGMFEKFASVQLNDIICCPCSAFYDATRDVTQFFIQSTQTGRYFIAASFAPTGTVIPT